MQTEARNLARVIVHDETRATAIVAALAESETVTLSSLPLSAYAAEIRRDWRIRADGTDLQALGSELAEIFDRLGIVVRSAVADGEWDWGDHPPASFASWLEQTLRDL